MALALLGLPVAEVVCDTLCPPAADDTVAAGARLASTRGPAPCHEGAASSSVVPLAESTAAAGVVDAHPHDACEHPAIVTARGASAGLRLAPPVAVCVEVMPPPAVSSSRLLLEPVHLLRPPPLAVGAFAPALRI